jgi:hypothetical protein
MSEFALAVAPYVVALGIVTAAAVFGIVIVDRVRSRRAKGKEGSHGGR